MKRTTVQKLRRVIQTEIKKILKENTFKSDPHYNEVHGLFTKHLSMQYDFPRKVALIGTSRGFPDWSEATTVKNASELADLVLKAGVSKFGSIEEFRESIDDWQGDAETFKEWADNLSYESTNGMAIGIDEDSGFDLEPESDEDEDEDED